MRRWICLTGLFFLAVLHWGCASISADPILENPALPPLTIHPAPQHPPLVLVTGGELKFALVADLAAEKRFRYRNQRSISCAIELLQEAFQKCVGQVPALIDVNDRESLAKYSTMILVGESSLTKAMGLDAGKLPKEGFTIQTFSNGVAIVGNDSTIRPDFGKDPLDHMGPERGTLHGAYDFIERFLDCRFFFPGEFGSLWPERSELTIAPMNYLDYPRFANRSPSWVIWTLMGEENQKKWAPLIGEYKFPEDLPFQERWRLADPEPFWAGHNPEPRAFYKAYPDQQKTIFYQAPNGNLYFNEKQHIGNYFDVTNLEFADLLIDSLKKYYRTQGKENDGWTMLSNSFIPFGQCDSGVPLPDMIGKPIVRELNLISEANLKSKSPYGDIYGRFYQYFAGRLREELPGKKILLLPYSEYTEAPVDPRWSLPDNIEVRVCIGDFPSRTRDAKAIKRWQQGGKAWYEALGQRPIASLWLYNVPGNPYARAIAPMFVGEVPKLLGKYLGRQSLFLDQYGGLEWYYYAANYVACRSMWNPDFKVEAAIAEHWVPFYGAEAGPLLQEFQQLLLDSYMRYFIGSEERNPLYPLSVIERLESLLQQAGAKLAADSVEMKRYKVFAHPWADAFTSQRNRHNYERPVNLISRRLEGEVFQLDGKLDEPLWGKCQQIELRDPRGTDMKPGVPVYFQLAWDDKGLYGAYRMKGKYLADDNRSVWNNCNVEMFFSPTMAREYMCHYAIDASSKLHAGHKQFTPVDQPYNAYWKSPGFQFAVSTSADEWSLEFFLPFADLSTPVPKAYDCWYANLVSNNNTKPGHYMGNSMTLGNNHNFEQYGIIKFLGKGD